MGKFCVSDRTEHLTMMLLALVVAATAVAAVPVERTNGVLSTIYRDDFELSNNNQHHFVAFNRGCPGCRGRLVPRPFAYRYPYHLSDAYEERGLVKRSPEKLSKKFGKKSLFSIKKGGKGTKFFGKNLGKSFKPGKPQNKAKKFGKKNLAKAGKPGTPQNKKAKKGGKKAFKKGSKGAKKGGKGFSKAAKKSSPISVPALGLGGGGSLAFGVPGTGFAGFAVPGLAQAGFDYVTG